MIGIYRNLFFSLFILAGTFIFGSICSADIFKDQYNPAYSGSTYPTRTKLVIQSFQPAQNNVSRIIAPAVLANDIDITLFLCQGIPTELEDFDCTNNILLDSAFVENYTSDGNGAPSLYFDFTSPITVNPYGNYYFSMVSTAGFYKTYTSGNYYGNGRAIGCKDWENCAGTMFTDQDDLNFSTWYDPDFTPEALINISNPVTGTTFHDFDTWQTTGFISIETPQYVFIEYGIDPLIPIYADNGAVFDTFQESFLYSDFLLSIPKLNSLADGVYYAQAILKTYDPAFGFVQIASSTQISFTISSSSPISANDDSILNPPRAFPVQTCAGIDTGTIFGAIECAFRKVLDWAFTPRTTSVIDFQNNYTKLKASFPFNVFYSLTDTMSMAFATTTTANDTFGIPFIDDDGDYYILPVLSSSSMPNLIGSENNSLFRSTVGWLIWLCLALFIFLQIRSI